MAINNATGLSDPFQGYDIKVTVTPYTAETDANSTTKLGGSFTGFMCRIVNQTEAYLPLNQRIPRMLDGEVIVAWSLEQGAVNDKWVAATYGTEFAKAMKQGRQATPIPRQRRFKIQMETVTEHIKDLGEEAFRNDGGGGETPSNAINTLKLTLNYCRVDTGSFGVVAGRRVAASSWQGTAQSVSVD